MSRICQGCGGVLGRDCYNEYDCVQIGKSMEIHDTVQPYIEALTECRTVLDWMESHMQIPSDDLIEAFSNMFDNIQSLINQLAPKQRTPEQIQQDLDDLPF